MEKNLTLPARGEKNLGPRAARLMSALLLTGALGLGAAALVPEPALAEDGAAAATEQVTDPAAATDPAASAYRADQPPAISAPVALLVDRDTGTVLYEAGADDVRTPASLTKVMTALVTLENASLTDVVTVEQADLDNLTPESSVAGLRAGETLTVRDLLACLLIPSGNDAAYVLARHVAGDWQTFVGMMNSKAAELGCASTTFTDPCGLSSTIVTTARDLVTIFEAALAHPEFSEISGSATWDLPATEQNPARTLETTDYLIEPDSPVYMGDAIVASKTGFTDDAGKCVIASAERDGMRLVGIVMGAADDADEDGVTPNFYDLRDLFEWGFGAWETGYVVLEGDVLASREVTLSKDGDAVDVAATGSVFATVPRGTTVADLTVEVPWAGEEPLQAPVESGSSLGEATVSLGGRVLGSTGVATAGEMELSIPDFLVWWLTSDPLHMLAAAGGFAVVVLVVGLLATHGSRKRRRQARARARAGARAAKSPAQPRAKGVPTIAPGSGRHAAGRPAPKHGKHMK